MLTATTDAAIAADQAGFDDAWFAEHHFMSYGLCPSAMTLAAFVHAGRALTGRPFASHPATAADMTPAEAARGLLARAHITEPPVPVEQLARDAGAVISYQPFEAEDISGLLYRAAGAAPVIGVNSNNPKVRQRFTIGHELGHLTLHHGHDLILERLVRLNFRDATSSTASDEEEIEANHFAAELLMPHDLLRHTLSILLQGRPLSDLEVVRRLARRFEVSQSAMEYRLTSLGMLTPA